jgi:probable phosphoglycerate mutase
MALLLLIRHGENDYTRKQKLAGHLPGVHLNERGLAQARDLAAAFEDVPLRCIFSSPLERARQTAAPIARVCGLKLQIEAGLLETDVGEWQGRSLASLRLNKLWKLVQHAPSRVRFPGGETFYECQTRVAATLDRILRRHKPRDIIACVFHADPIKLAVAHYIGLPLDNFQRISCDTGSVTALALGEMGASLVKSNQRPPLDFLPRRKSSGIQEG